MKKGDVRDDLVFEAGEEEDGDFGYGGDDGIGGPDLVAERSEVACWGDDAAAVSYCPGGCLGEAEVDMTYEGMSFRIDRKVFSRISPEILPLA